MTTSMWRFLNLGDLVTPGNWTPQQIDAVQKIHAEFAERCHRLYFAFDGLGMNRDSFLKEYKKDFTSPKQRNVKFAAAFQTNDDPNHIELSVAAEMNQKEIIEASRPEGEFENLNCQALIVFMFQLWEELYRPQFAKTLRIKPKHAQWNLFGDLRLIRHAIIHNKAELTKTDCQNLKTLNKLWDLKPGQLNITSNMISKLMNQLNKTNAIRPVSIPPQGSTQ